MLVGLFVCFLFLFFFVSFYFCDLVGCFASFFLFLFQKNKKMEKVLYFSSVYAYIHIIGLDQ